MSEDRTNITENHQKNFRAALALSLSNENITEEHEQDAFPGLALLVATIKRTLTACNDMGDPCQQFTDFMEGKPYDKRNILRIIEILHHSMMEERRVVSMYALEPSARVS